MQPCLPGDLIHCLSVEKLTTDVANIEAELARLKSQMDRAERAGSDIVPGLIETCRKRSKYLCEEKEVLLKMSNSLNEPLTEERIVKWKQGVHEVMTTNNKKVEGSRKIALAVNQQDGFSDKTQTEETASLIWEYQAIADRAERDLKLLEANDAPSSISSLGALIEAYSDAKTMYSNTKEAYHTLEPGFKQELAQVGNADNHCDDCSQSIGTADLAMHCSGKS